MRVFPSVHLPGRGWPSVRASLALALLLAVLASGCASSPGPAPPTSSEEVAPEPPADAAPRNQFLLDGLRPPGGDLSDGAEPSILVDRLGRAIWVGDTSGLTVSYDNGTTWKAGPYPFLLSADGWGLAQDDEGVLYMSTTALGWVDVARSEDLGRTATVVGRFVDAAPIADRPWIAARGDGEVAMVFYAFGRVVDEACVRSTDGGSTWLDRQPFAGHANPGNLVYDDQGALYFAEGSGEVWHLPDGCGLASISYTRSPFRIFGGRELGANNQLQVATAGDALYAVAAGEGNREMLLAGSRGLGTPRLLTVSPPQLASNTFGAVSTWGDEVAVAWYGSETPGDPSAIGYGGAFNVYVARVRDFWGTPHVTYYRLTDEPNHVGDICMGGIGCTEEADRDLLDYFGVDHDPWGGIHVAYGHDGAGSSALVRYARVPPGFPGTTLDLPAPPLPGGLPAAAPVDDGETPTARFTHNETGLLVRVDASGSADPQGDALTYQWSWGDGTAGEGKKAEHTYARSGAYTILLRVTDGDGRAGTVQQGIIADGGSNNRAPQVKVGVDPERPVATAPITLTDLSTDPDGRIVGRAWEVDGKQAGTERGVSVQLAAGEHSVRLRVTDDKGASSTGGVRLLVGTGLAGDAPAAGGEPAGPVTVSVPAAPLAAAVLSLAAAAAVAARRR